MRARLRSRALVFVVRPLCILGTLRITTLRRFFLLTPGFLVGYVARDEREILGDLLQSPCYRRVAVVAEAHPARGRQAAGFPPWADLHRLPHGLPRRLRDSSLCSCNRYSSTRSPLWR